jgi:hypothetical protein
VPNYCFCKLRVEGGPQDLKAFRDRVRSDDIDEKSGKPFPIDFEKHVPMPPEISRESPPNTLPEWYHWRNEHWGTKWNSLYPRGPRGSFKSGRLEYRFATAWAPPEPWMNVVAAEHPKLYFELEFEIEMGWGGGLLRWRRGRQLKPR